MIKTWQEREASDEWVPDVREVSMQLEIDELRAELAKLKEVALSDDGAGGEGLMLYIRNRELIAELAALKSQEAVARIVIDSDGEVEIKWVGPLINFAVGTKLYLAAGAQTIPAGYQLVPVEPTEAMWGGLARDIMMWLDFERKTPAVLFKHLERCGGDLPQWLREEPEMRNLDHVPSKGTRVSIIYKAMLEAAKEQP